MSGVIYINGKRIYLANVKKTKTSKTGLTLFYRNGKKACIAASVGGYWLALSERRDPDVQLNLTEEPLGDCAR